MDAGIAPRPWAQKDPSADHQGTILVVDDMPENLHVLGGLLSPQYRVRVANSGIRALQVAASPPR
ncbi:MAG: hypothetical protein RBS40_07735, partial [Rhodocyclaceae bacterium]|nr:hypothetical protein [Rhodocyclaceae bacterium]